MNAFKIFSVSFALLTTAGLTLADEKSAIAKIESLGGRVLYLAKGSKQYSVTITKDMFAKDKSFKATDAKALAELKSAVEISFQHPPSYGQDSWGQSPGLSRLAGPGARSAPCPCTWQAARRCTQ